MTTKNIFIGPEKFTIFDSDVSDSESETDEWVSVSTSTTISTMSTLPPHLNLNPRTTIKTRPQPPDCGPARPQALFSPTPSPPAAQLPPPPPLPPSVKTAAVVAAGSPTPPKQISDLIVPPQPSTPQESPIIFLKRFFPTLTAIYIVSPTSIYPSTTHDPTNTKCHTPFSTLTTIQPNPPISTKATRPSSNVVETYIRICADCAKPPMTIYCDRTWTGSSSVSAVRRPCSIHSPAFPSNFSPSLSPSPTSTSNSRSFDANNKHLTCGKCTHMTQILDCLDCAGRRDATLFQAVIDAVSPFRRIETEMLGIAVFDMSVPVAGEVYRHVEGCDCVR